MSTLGLLVPPVRTRSINSSIPIQKTCYFPSLLPIIHYHPSSQKVLISALTQTPHGKLFCYNKNLCDSIAPNVTGPCFLMTVIPQLTLYRPSEFYLLFPSTCKPRESFLPVMVGLTLITTLAGMAMAMAHGNLGHSVLSTICFEPKIQVSLGSPTRSLASFQDNSFL